MQREVARHCADVGCHAEHHIVGGEFGHHSAVEPHGGAERVQIHIRLDPRSHRLESIAVLGAPKRAVARLPSALADIVADGVAKHAGQRLFLRQMLGLPADDNDKLAFVLKALGGVGRLHDGFAVSDEGVVGAIADVRLLRDVRFAPQQRRRFAHMLFVVDAGGVEGFRLKRDKQPHIVKRSTHARLGVFAEWRAVHFLYRDPVVSHDAV